MSFYKSKLILQARGPIILKEETTRNLLTCVIWVLKNVEKSVLKMWWSDISIVRLQTLLEVLRICISCFQYKVRTRRACVTSLHTLGTHSQSFWCPLAKKRPEYGMLTSHAETRQECGRF